MENEPCVLCRETPRRPKQPTCAECFAMLVSAATGGGAGSIGSVLTAFSAAQMNDLRGDAARRYALNVVLHAENVMRDYVRLMPPRDQRSWQMFRDRRKQA